MIGCDILYSRGTIVERVNLLFPFFQTNEGTSRKTRSARRIEKTQRVEIFIKREEDSKITAQTYRDPL